MRPHTAAAVVAALFLAVCLFGRAVAPRLLLLGVGIILAAIVLHQQRGTLRALPPIWLPFFAWGTWAALSLAWSRDPEHTLWEWRNEVFYTAAACWFCYVAAQARYAAHVFVAVLGLGAIAVCGTALYEFSRGWDRYLVGRHGGPGDHSSALLILMPCVALAGWYASRKRLKGHIGAACFLAALLFASAYTTLNRTLWLGFALQFGLLGLLLLLRARIGRVKLLAPVLAVAAIAGGAAVVLSIQADRQALGVARPVQEDPRLALWPQIAAHIAERPLTGHGFGRGMLRDALLKEFKDYDGHLWHAHNLFLEALLQVGAPGLALLLFLLFAVARAAWHRAQDPDDLAAACGMAALAVLAGMVMRNMTDTLLVRQNALLFWGSIGVLLGLTQGLRSRAGNGATAPVGG